MQEHTFNLVSNMAAISVVCLNLGLVVFFSSSKWGKVLKNDKIGICHKHWAAMFVVHLVELGIIVCSNKRYTYLDNEKRGDGFLNTFSFNS